MQSRRARTGRPDAGRRGTPPQPSRPPRPSRVDPWQAIAIVALIAATAGWTTVALLASRDSSVAVASATPSTPEPEVSDEATLPPVADTHDAPELEAFLPLVLEDTPLQVQSWTGDALMIDDAWSTSMTGFLTANGNTAEDMRFAQVADPTQALDVSIGVYRVPGVEATAVRDALIDAWKADYPDVQATTVTLDGEEVTKLDFGEDTIASYLYVRDDVVFDIGTSDDAIAAAAIASLPGPGASPAPSRPPSPSSPG